MKRRKTKPHQASPMNDMDETMKDLAPIKPAIKVETADEWSRLFERYGQTETAWIGADGIFSFALDGNDALASATDRTKTFFIFSDTLFGTASQDGRKAVREAMPNHTSAILEGNKPDAAPAPAAERIVTTTLTRC